ncbi:hypothetical protein QBC38DRAFT_58244 [Podospora fimiseda]|uniref:YAG7-like dimerisation domain-containing protein n=1 Tax=Podospora fimiseda TaxID=252190 RepID=A0AAN7GS25_9PEZI|nr:hypothetical protein QBC38DRAFT_58244 [Podospora fimiseda]
MAAPVVQNPPAPVESKSAKKKKAKAAAAAATERTESPAPASQKAASVAGTEDEQGESAHIRELQKSVRNITKKLTLSAKVETIINQHKDKTLDELIEAKIINADQKASHLKRPGLQAQLFQLEQQLALLKTIEQEHRAQLAKQEKALTEKFEKEKEQLIAETKQKAADEGAANLKTDFLLVSQFLRLAASRRAEDHDATLDENQALEGILLYLYSGDDNAVATMNKLVQGSDEQTRSTGGETLQTTYAQVKEATIKSAIAYYQPPSEPAVQSTETETEPELVPEASAAATDAEIAESTEELKHDVETDPTVANAGLTEVEEGSATALANGHPAEETPSGTGAPANADVTDSAANAAGESQWDIGTSMTESQEWVDVQVPREASETETGVTATPAQPSAPATNQSWADDHPEGESAAPADDGFQSVQGRSRGPREGGHRGRGGHHHRGRGSGSFRGEGRGRGRGGGRGGFPPRARRNEENA